MIRAIILNLILCVAVIGFAEDKKADACVATCPEAKSVAADQVPAAAVAALTKLAGGTAPTAYFTCSKDGKNIFCVMQKSADGAVCKFAVTADGVEVKNCAEACKQDEKAGKECCPADKKAK